MEEQKQTNDSEKIVIRNEKGQIVSGVNNPKGKPVGTKHFTSVVIEALKVIAKTEDGKDIEIEKALGEQVVKMALAGNEQMIKLIWNYRDGLPKATVELEDNRTEETREELRKLIEIMKNDK